MSANGSRSLEDRIRRLEDVEAIRNLAARYCFVIDDRDLEGIGDCFCEDGRFRSVDGKMDSRSRQEVMDQYHGRFEVLGPANHIAHQHVVDLDPDDPDRATGTISSHAEVVRNGKVMLSALRYDDVYRRDPDGRWRFLDRVLSFFYYVEPKDYVSVFDTPERNHAYESPHAADIPEGLESYQAYYAAHPRRL
jgi:ketosteroid isomerase-like protein